MIFTCLYTGSPLVWAWRRSEPALREGEVLVGESGRVLACSAGLQRIGVEPEQALERARALAQERELTLHERPHPGLRLDLAWEEALSRLNGFTPWLEALRPGLVVAELGEGEAAQAATLLGLQAGRASWRQLAWLAALTLPEGGLRSIPPGREADFRQAFSVVTLQSAGISQDTVQNLLWLGFPRLGDLARLSVKQLAARFAEGEQLSDLVHGCDRHPVPLYHPPPEAVARLARLEPWEQPAELEPVLRHLLAETLTQLEGRRPRWFTLLLEPPQGPRRQARRGLHQPTTSPRRLWPPLQRSLTQLWRPGFEVESIQLALGGLLSPTRAQGTLWNTRSSRQLLSQSAQVRCPGQLKTVELHQPQAYLPEESWSFKTL